MLKADSNSVQILSHNYWKYLVALVSVHGHLETGSDAAGKIKLAATFNYAEEESEVAIAGQEGEQLFWAGDGHNMEKDICWQQ